MRKAIADLSEVLVIARVSKTVMPMRVPTGQVFEPKLAWYSPPMTTASRQSCHRASTSSGRSPTARRMRDRVRYTPSDVFETFPRPEPTERLEQAAGGRSTTSDARSCCAETSA